MTEIRINLRVVIRADASVQIGSGHVMRCLTLADALRERGAEVYFVCRELPGHLGEVLANKDYPTHWLPTPDADATTIPAHTAHSAWLGVPWEEDTEQMWDWLETLPEVDWLIVDHYALDQTWESQLRPQVKRIMVMDDLADRPHDCDLLLDQNLHENMEQRYTGLVPKECRLLLGPRYALLRPEFLEARKNLRQRDGTVRRILVFFGGADPSNETTKALRALQLLDRPDIAVDVVVGSANPHRSEIEALCAALPNTSFYCQVSNMAELMARADLAIGGGGSATWERFCVGLPSLVISLAENQLKLIQTLANMGLIFYFNQSNKSDISLVELIRILCASQHYMFFLSNSAKDLVDGRGVYITLRKIISYEIRIRPADWHDRRSIFLWRNAEENRRYSFNSKVINYREHCNWLKCTINDRDKLLLIGELNGSAIGVLRYDISKCDAIVSIYLVRGKYGQGMGSSLLAAGNSWLQKNATVANKVIASVLSANIASEKAFKEAGFKKENLTFTFDLSNN